jgi:hypothetical protein
MQFSAGAVDWGVRPWVYAIIWLAWLGSVIGVGFARRAFKAGGIFRNVLGAALLLISAVLFIAASYELQLIFRFASWPPFSFTTFAIAGLPVYIVVAALYLKHRRRR